VYLLVFFAIKIIVSILLSFFSLKIYCGLFIAILWLVYTVVVSLKIRPYENAHKIRLHINNALFLVILAIFIFNKFTYTLNGEKDIHIHLPYSIIVLIGLCFAINISFWVYSIKKLRCCELSIDWEKTAKIS
jgi:hypothetical protein